MPQKPCLGVSCVSFNTDFPFSFLFHVLFLSSPLPSLTPTLSLCPSVRSPHGFTGISLPFRALSLPCRTRPRKAASAQSSRSGGEGGSVRVGMERTASTGESGPPSRPGRCWRLDRHLVVWSTDTRWIKWFCYSAPWNVCGSQLSCGRSG